MMTFSASIELLADSISKAQGELPLVTLDKTVSYKGVHYEYASLGNMIHTCKPILAKHGLAVLQFPSSDGPAITIETMLLHASGQWMMSKISGKLGKPDDPKEAASLITYYRRYSYGSIVGCPLDGDYDGELISQKYTASNEHKVWLRDVLIPMGVDQKTMAAVSEVMLKGNYEMTEDAVGKALEVLRK